MWTLLASVAAALVNALVGRFFPGHPKVTPEVIAQAQKDRADALQSQKDARAEADKLRADIRVDAGRGAVGDPRGGLFKHDANELRDPP